MVAIIGSAGPLTRAQRDEIERLAVLLSQQQFDLVTGGRSGVMRAVSRGYHLASENNNLIHIDPGWEGVIKANPYNASVVRTELGSMRNHLVIRAADIVIAVGGGAGTLSEIAIAWQEQKPIFCLQNLEGWSSQLSGSGLDQRRNDSILGFETAEALVQHVSSLRPSGVFGGRMNRDLFPGIVPAIHRIHCGRPDGVHAIHDRFGMTIEIGDLTMRLNELNELVKTQRPDTRALITFDDGWSDVLRLVPAFREFHHLLPVVFVGENHFSQQIRPLPIQRWYQHCFDSSTDVEPFRSQLKGMQEEEAHKALDALGVEPMFDPEWLLSFEDLEILSAESWLIGSHGHVHGDLTSRQQLNEEFSRLGEAIENRLHMPWLCWPEGKWSMKSYEAARSSGFALQFGLKEEPHPEPIPKGLVLRTIWG